MDSGRQSCQKGNPKDIEVNEVKETMKALSGIMLNTYTTQK